MNFTDGTRLGSYEIISRIGAGGMGEVFRARDARIGRDVAIKVLPATFASNPDWLRRFEQEARTAGSLNHPNLVTIFELGTHDGSPFIVMELLEGETLREKLGEGEAAHTLPHRKAVDYAFQLASGLAAAHDKGVVHRDLKPENIFVTSDGRLKILDFGLAKLRDAQGGGEDDRTQQRGTAPGTVLGTAGYMSPEQVRGLEVDQRSDIFSFGTIVYEMLAGIRAFRGPSSVETMNAVLHKDPPDFTAAGEHVSPPLERLIRRCLEKERDERFHSARDIAFALDAVSGSSSGAAAPVSRAEPARMRKWTPWVAAALGIVLGLAGSAGIVRLRGNSRPEPPASFSQLTYSAGAESEPSLAPDGKTFAFVRVVDGQSDIFVQRIDGQSAINVTKGRLGNESQPAFSPDGSQIAFCSCSEKDGGIFVMGTTGESVRRLTDKGFNPSWSPDGREIVHASEAVRNPRLRTSVSTLSISRVEDGATRLLFKGDAMQPRWSPDGRRIAFWSIDQVGNREVQTIGVKPDDGASLTNVTREPATDWNPVWSADGRSIYFLSDRDGSMNLWRVAIDPERGLPTAPATSARLPAMDVAFLSSPGSDGRLLYQSATSRGELRHATFDPRTETLRSDAGPLFEGSMLIRAAAISPDGNWIAFNTDGKQEDVFVMRADGTDVRQLTRDLARDRGVSWWPDSSRIVFYSNRVDTYEAWSIRPDGSGLTRLTKSPAGDRGNNYPRVSPDGTALAVYSIVSGGQIVSFVGATPFHAPKTLPPLPGASGSFWPTAWSRDGRRILGTDWARLREGNSGIYVYSFDTNSYDLVHPTCGVGGWLDESRIACIDLVGNFQVVDLRTKAVRSVGRVDSWDPAGAISAQLGYGAGDIVYPTLSTEADIWMMSSAESSTAESTDTAR